jgi:hypothetical protein
MGDREEIAVLASPIFLFAGFDQIASQSSLHIAAG